MWTTIPRNHKKKIAALRAQTAQHIAMRHATDVTDAPVMVSSTPAEAWAWLDAHTDTRVQVTPDGRVILGTKYAYVFTLIEPGSEAHRNHLAAEERAAQYRARRLAYDQQREAERVAAEIQQGTDTAAEDAALVAAYQASTPRDLIPAVKIVIEWSEAAQFGEGEEISGPGMWAEFNRRAADARRARLEEARAGGYDKTKFHVHYADGETYSGRYDIAVNNHDGATLEAHILNHVRFMTGQHQPAHFTAEEYAAYLLAAGNVSEEYARFLARYRIGGTPAQPRAEKPRVRLNLDGTFTRLDQPAAPANISFYALN